MTKKFNLRVLPLNWVGNVLSLTVLIVTLLASALVILNSSVVKATAENLSKSFDAELSVVSGSLVSLKQGNEGQVVLANSTIDDHIIGVAVEPDDSLLAMNPSTSKVQVAISGQAWALVSNIAGDIKAGDLIAQSPISGVGAKAKPGDKTVGIAIEDFDSSKSTNRQTITNKHGQSREITIVWEIGVRDARLPRSIGI